MNPPEKPMPRLAKLSEAEQELIDIFDLDDSEKFSQAMAEYADSLTTQLSQNELESDEDKISTYFKLYLITSFGPNDIKNLKDLNELMLKYTSSNSSSNLEIINNFTSLTVHLTNEAFNYFHRGDKPYDFAVTSELENPFANQAMNIYQKHLKQTMEQRFGLGNLPNSSIELVPIKNSRINALWMTNSGIPPKKDILEEIAESNKE